MKNKFQEHSKYILFLILIHVSLYSCSLNSTSTLKEVVNSDTIIIYSIITPTASEFKTIRTNVNLRDTLNNYYKKEYYVDSMLIKIETYDSTGNLFDPPYSHALIIYEYNKDKSAKKLMLFDKNRNRIEDKFQGYWSLEYFFNLDGKKVKQIAKDSSGNLVKYMPLLPDIIPPIIEYQHSENKINIKIYDENYRLIKEEVCEDFDTCLY
jgi:hypothetical protein